MLSMALGRQIKKIRESKNLSQFELAKRLKYLNQSQVSKIEKGDRKVTALDLIEIAKALEVTVEEIASPGKETA